MVETASMTLGWYADPTTRHEQRFFDGRRWTDHVADGAVRSVDGPRAEPATAEPLVVLATAPPAASLVVGPQRAPRRIDLFEWCFKVAMVGLLVTFLVVIATKG